jgi:hypothetical protein
MEKFKIIETMQDFRVQKLVPSLKLKRNFWGWPSQCYKDYDNMIWVNLTRWGRPDYPSSNIHYIPCPVTFKTLDEAKEFVEKLKRQKIEIEI